MLKTVRMACLFLLTMTLVGCTDKEDKYDDSYIRLHKDGSVTEYIEEDFDEDIYSKDDLVKMIETEMNAYNKRFPEKRIGLKSCKVSDDEIKVKMEYKSVQDYASFNGVELFVSPSETDNTKTLTMGFPYDVYIDGKIISYSDGIRMIDKHRLSMDDVDSGYIIYE